MKLASIVALAAMLAAPGERQARPQVVMTCDVAVLDAAGVPIRNLGPKDFEASIGGVPVPLLAVSPGPANVSAVLIVDVTTSQPLKRYEINSALATEWLTSLRPYDRIRIGVLAQPLAMTAWLPIDPRTAASAAKQLIDRAAPEPSPLWDATGAAIDALAGESNAKFILLVSDGRSNANRIGLDEAAERALAAGVTISTVGEGGERLLAQAGDDAARVRPDVSLQWLAEQTGGAYLPDGVARRTLRPQQDPFAYVRELVQTPSRPGPLLVTLTNAMRLRYRLSVAVPADGQLRRLDVRVLAPGATAYWPRRIMAPSR